MFAKFFVDRPVFATVLSIVIVIIGLVVLTVACFAALALVTPMPPFYFAGVAMVGALLWYEQSLVRADDLSQVKRAFDLNGYVGILYLVVLAVSLYVR